MHSRSRNHIENITHGIYMSELISTHVHILPENADAEQSETGGD